MRSHGGKLVAVERFNVDSMDIRNQILKLMAAEPEGIFINGFGTPYIASINRLKEYKYAGYILTEISMVASNQMDQIHDIDKVIFLETLFDIQKNTGKMAKFVEEYKKAFHTEPTIVGAFAYEALMLYREAIQKGQNIHDLRTGFSSIRNYPSIVGDITYLDGGEIYFPLIVVTADKNKNIIVLDQDIGKSFSKENMQ